jgi:hypothetical protein
MTNPDHDTVLQALEHARRILGDYIESGPHDVRVTAEWLTVERLLDALDRDEVVHALDRMKRRRTLRLV